MRCYICDKDCPDTEIKLEKKPDGSLSFGPCNECREVISRSVLAQEIGEEEAPTVPLWDIE